MKLIDKLRCAKRWKGELWLLVEELEQSMLEHSRLIDYLKITQIDLKNLITIFNNRPVNLDIDPRLIKWLEEYTGTLSFGLNGHIELVKGLLERDLDMMKMVETHREELKKRKESKKEIADDLRTA